MTDHNFSVPTAMRDNVRNYIAGILTRTLNTAGVNPRDITSTEIVDDSFILFNKNNQSVAKLTVPNPQSYAAVWEADFSL